MPAAAPQSHPSSDVLIVGAGIIGLSLALELHARGARVTVIERGAALAHASTAAAGMLAVDDPHNPPALHPLSMYSRVLYPAFLERIEQLSGLTVPFQTDVTLQYDAGGHAERLPERSLDPRQLAAALLAAIRATPVQLREHTALQHTGEMASEASAVTTTGERLRSQHVVHALGAWTQPIAGQPGSVATFPRKGQMLRVALPPALKALHDVHRDEHVYVVPRTAGPQAGTALLGATVEDAGYDLTTHAAALGTLRRMAARLVPGLEDTGAAPQVEAWAGLRPATPDLLPILGNVGESPARWIASGHYRNGILLAPATAHVLADLLERKTPAVDLRPFSPARVLHGEP